MTAKDKRLSALRSSIPEIQPKEALDLQKTGAPLIDVRESDEFKQGSPAHAHRLGRGFLELKIEEVAPELDKPVMVMCGGGVRSLFAAENLQQLGYSDVRSVAGGFARWKNDGLPFETPRLLDDDARERYSRHLMMPDIGTKGQLKLLDSKVLLIGAGGLGSPSSYYLAAAGIGTVGLVDHDVVDRSNLQRQILHTENSVGTPKVESARIALEALNPKITINTYQTHIDSDNIDDIIEGYDVVVDGSDNLPTRYLINDACIKHKIPNVHAAVYRFEGQLTVFWPSYDKQPGPCYRCLFPEPPPPEAAPSCATAGVLGVMPGTLGLLQAVETVKILLDLGKPLVGKMLYYDALYAEFRNMNINRNPNCAYCGDDITEFPGYVDYAAVCGSA